MWIQEWTRQHLTGRDVDDVTLLVDPAKSAYQAWSIPSSTIAAFGLANFWYYVKAFFCRGKFPILKGNDAGQLGADFVVGHGGTLLLKHYCRNPTDRIDVATILEKLRQVATVSK
jgi:hypothetical protein